MANAKNGDKVTIHYIGKLDDGTVFDTSAGSDPLEFTLGEGMVIPGFENAVLGMAPGEVKTVTIAPEDGYGDYDEEMILEVEREAFPDELELEVGLEVQSQDPSGQVVELKVLEFDDAMVKLDANQPLAGENLTFEIEVVSIG